MQGQIPWLCSPCASLRAPRRGLKHLAGDWGLPDSQLLVRGLEWLLWSEEPILSLGAGLVRPSCTCQCAQCGTQGCCSGYTLVRPQVPKMHILLSYQVAAVTTTGVTSACRESGL